MQTLVNGGDERAINMFTAFAKAGLRWMADAVAALDELPTASALDAATSI